MPLLMPAKVRTFDRVVATAQRGSAILHAKPLRGPSRGEDDPMWNQDCFTEAKQTDKELRTILKKLGVVA